MLLCIWCIYFCAVTSSGSVTVKSFNFTENASLENFLINENIISETESSLVKCGVNCAGLKVCSSFSYNTVTKTCRTHSTTFWIVLEPVFSQGTRTYNLQGWPSGTYALPKPVDGCPTDGQWNEGWRFQDTDDSYNVNEQSDPIRLSGYLNTNGVRLEYCVKTVSFVSERPYWPEGKYCILKKGYCPQGFAPQSKFWNDEDNQNSNDFGGVLPNGIYDQDTLIYFCCRDDASAAPLSLPTESPFYLFPLITDSSSLCPNVVGMVKEKHYIFFDNELDPFRLDYCYYKRI